MKKIIPVLGALAFLAAVSGCSAERHSKTTTHEETIESAPTDPVVIEKRSSTRTETRTSD